MRFLNDWLLTVLLLTPALGGAAVLLARSRRAARPVALGVAIATFCLSLLVLLPFRFRQGTSFAYGPGGAVQLLRQVELIRLVGADYRVAIDGLSLPFVLVTTILAALCCAASSREVARPRTYFAMLLWLEAATLGTFVSFDLLLLWAFVAAAVVPACALLWLSSGTRRAGTTLAFLLPMLVSLACLFALVVFERAVHSHSMGSGTLDIVRLAGCGGAGAGAARALFAVALVAFLVRLPIVPVHGWMGLVERNTSAAAAAIVGSLVPLTGGYGIFRVVLPLFPAASASKWWLIAGLGLLIVAYHGLATMGRNGSIGEFVHPAAASAGFALLGSALLTPAAISGGVFLLLGGALITAFVFLSRPDAPPESPGATNRGSQRGMPSPPMQSLAWLMTLVTPLWLGQAIVVIGAFTAAGPSSPLVASRVARPVAILTVAILACGGTVLLGAATAVSVGLLTGQTAPALNRAARDDSPWYAPFLGAAILLFGTVGAPFCLALARHALTIVTDAPR